jgi:hypothetical protein
MRVVGLPIEVRDLRRPLHSHSRFAHEVQERRAYVINGADPQLAGSAAGILFANNVIERRHYDAALTYARLHAFLFGTVCRCQSPLGWKLAVQCHEPADGLVASAEQRIATVNARLTLEQRQAVANLSVYGFAPQFFFAEKLKLRALPEDERERQVLLSGLDAIASSRAD